MSKGAHPARSAWLILAGLVVFMLIGYPVSFSLAAVGRVFRQSGLGGLMYQDVLVECQRLGFRRAETTISASNTDVANVFARLGFGILRTRFCLHRFGG